MGGKNRNCKNSSETICVVSREARLLFHARTLSLLRASGLQQPRDVSHLLLLPAPSPLQVLATRQPSDLNMKPTEGDERRRRLPLLLPSSHRLLRVCLCEDPPISRTDGVSEEQCWHRYTGSNHLNGFSRFVSLFFHTYRSVNPHCVESHNVVGLWNFLGCS